MSIDQKTIEETISNLPLPQKIIDNLQRELQNTKVTKKQLDEIIRRTTSVYDYARIEAGEAAGVVSAQSIGEPGTQMSIAGSERVIVKIRNKICIIPISVLVDSILNRKETHVFNGSEVCNVANEPMFVPSLNENGKIEWKKLLEVSRHKYERKLLQIKTRSGRKITATDNHSFVMRINSRIVPVLGSKLKEGDRIPVLKNLPSVPQRSFNVEEFLPKSEYWYGSELKKAQLNSTAGGFEVPVGMEQVKNHLNGNSIFDIENGFVYLYQTHSRSRIPECFILDDTFGWFVGAYLAEGNATKYYIRGFSRGHDVHINSSLLSDLLTKACGSTSKEKRIPDFALNASDEFIGALLRAYFSGDGNVSIERKVIRASSISKELIDGVCLLLSRLGIFATKQRGKKDYSLSISYRFAQMFEEKIGFDSEKKKKALAELSSLSLQNTERSYDSVDMTSGFGKLFYDLAKKLGMPVRAVNNFTKKQAIGRNTLLRYLKKFERIAQEKEINAETELSQLRMLLEEDVVWDEIVEVSQVETNKYVYDFSVQGLETFTTGEGIITHNTMRTFHYAGVAEINVTLGLPRLIEIVDARKNPSTPMMTIYLEKEYAHDRDKARELAWKIEATNITVLGSMSTDITEMKIIVELNKKTLLQRKITPQEIADKLEEELGILADINDNILTMKPEEASYRQLLQLVKNVQSVILKGIKEIKRVVIRKEEGGEYVLYTEGSALKEVLAIDGVDATRTRSNNINEIFEVMGIEAARSSLIHEAMETLREQGLTVDIRHIMLVADIMTVDGDVKPIGRHGISGEKASVLARAAFEVTVNHLLDSGLSGDIDELRGVTENVIVGQPIRLGTGNVKLIAKKKGE